ncbi:hypothetical protein, unlikely [Trypanosoma brucei gambiense DAL972]|uniref:Uncharacterized protein n=1 Tax=Trypanosoma brucei gambiense (strain MHOM/CI/86/DAL972) TaxID=679716 RepID=C9ZSI4_TRYB9|nr:hypothetical protein, unlikely [Trypanosoma brucei gambiense DAL972]CBH12368.1 hypothetical protein, unlikely [Trypanosoma brucei gambiense DAL972]|eukprot:XP_011774649.1 hypothetical protein, unlikely [Trypanosoma brucei gambiense DAL972]
MVSNCSQLCVAGFASLITVLCFWCARYADQEARRRRWWQFFLGLITPLKVRGQSRCNNCVLRKNGVRRRLTLAAASIPLPGRQGVASLLPVFFFLKGMTFLFCLFFFFSDLAAMRCAALGWFAAFTAFRAVTEFRLRLGCARVPNSPLPLRRRCLASSFPFRFCLRK